MSKETEKLKKQNKKLRKEIKGLRGDVGDLYNLIGEMSEQVEALYKKWAQEKPKQPSWGLPSWATKIEHGAAVITDSEGGKHYGKEQPDGSVDFGPFPAAKGVAAKIAAAPKRGGDVRRFTKRLDDPCTDCGAVGGVECPASCPRMMDEAMAEAHEESAWGAESLVKGGIIGWDPVEERPVQVREVTPNRDPEASEYTFWFTEEMCEQLGIPNIQRHLVEKPGTGGALEMVDGPPTKLLPEHRELVAQTIAEGQG